jgi:hypothetical protein
MLSLKLRISRPPRARLKHNSMKKPKLSKKPLRRLLPQERPRQRDKLT